MEKGVEFYGKKDLNGFSYYFHLPNIPLLEKKQISDKIFMHKGVINIFLLLKLVFYRKELYLFIQRALF